MKLKTIFLLLLGIVSLGVCGQTTDFGIWTTIGTQKELGHWDFSGETELRTKSNSSEIDRVGIGLSGAYEVFKPIKIGAGYEFLYYNDSEYDDYQPRHRLNLFISGKYKFGDFTFGLKEKVQGTAKDVSDRVKDNGNIDNYKVNPEYTWRNKINIDYNIPHFPVNPSLSVETFYSLNNPDGNSFEKLRYTLSLNYKLTKRHRFEVYGLYNQKLNATDSENRAVLGVAYQFKF